jgi:hypothetical protein
LFTGSILSKTWRKFALFYEKSGLDNKVRIIARPLCPLAPVISIIIQRPLNIVNADGLSVKRPSNLALLILYSTTSLNPGLRFIDT